MKRAFLIVSVVLAWLSAPLVVSSLGPHGGDSTQSPPGAGLAAGAGFVDHSKWMVMHWEWYHELDFDYGWLDQVIVAVDSIEPAPSLANGILRIDTTAVDNQGACPSFSDNLTAGLGVAGFAHPAAGRTIIYEIRVALNAWDATGPVDYAFGLMEITAQNCLTITGNWGNINDAVGFWANVAAAGITQAFYEENNNGQQLVGAVQSAVFTDGDYHVFTIMMRGQTYAEWWVDGVKQQSTSFTAITVPLTPFFGIVGTAADDQMDVDYITVSQTR